MEKVVISIMGQSPEPRDPNQLFAIVDLNKSRIEFINLEKTLKYAEVTHGMGMCYCDDLFVAGIIPPQRLRCASFLLLINLSNGERYLHNLNLTKAVHGICAIDNCRLIANSTQNDILSDISMHKGHLNEDVFYDFKPNRNLENLFNCFKTENCNIAGWRVSELDDKYHINGIYFHKNNVYLTMFNAIDSGKYGEEFKGVLYDLNRDKIVLNNLKQPHTPYVSQWGNLCCADSGNFRFVHGDTRGKFTYVDLDGYTRGICEDPARKGFWVGISAYRKFSKTQNKWIELHKDNIPLEGARLQFVSYKNEVKQTIDLAPFGIKEIFDILPFKTGKWNTI
jgi:hypothetical protein